MDDSEWTRLPIDRAEQRRDVLIAGVLAAGLAISVLLYSRVGLYPDVPPWWVCALMVVANAAPLAFRRRFPMTVVVVVAVAFAVTQLLHVPEALVSNITLFVALYTVGAWVSDRTRAAVVRWVVIGGMFAWLFVAILFHWGSPSTTPGAPDDGGISPYVAIALINIAINLLYFGAAYSFGDKAWAGARARASLDARTAELEREREHSAAQAVALDRVRIARELHDVVAHHVSVMGVQAGAARRVLTTDTAQATASLAAVEQSARTAVEELAHILGTLRSEPEDSAQGITGATRTPGIRSAPSTRTTPGESPSTRGIDRLPDLLDEARSTGHPARLTTVGDPRPLPPTVEVVAYRIAQEAVTNTIKHAGPGAEIDVRVRWRDDGVELEVSDTGRPGRAPVAGRTNGPGSRTGAGRPTDAGPRAGAGLGHVGMRERVAAVNGTVTVGPRTRGGYLVRAWLPA